MIKEFLEIGQIVGTHGVKGELRVHPWCDSPDFFGKFKTLYFDEKGLQAVRVLSCRPHGNVVLLCLDGVNGVDAAAALRGKVLFMRRADARLPEGSYFITELMGCAVVDADDENLVYGTLADASQTGANDVWHIKDNTGREYLLPAIPDVVFSVNIVAGVIKIRPLKGIFDDED